MNVDQIRRAEPADAGCWLDFSARNVHDFNRAILREAWEHGMVLSQGDEELLTNPDPGEEEMLYEASEDAVDWLTAHVAPEGYVFLVEDNSLFLEKE